MFTSVLTYLIPLWGNSENYLLKALQVVQNKAARCVTKLSWYTSTRQLLKQCGWMSIKQLIFYHTVLTISRILKSGKPVYLRSKLSTDFPYPTRQATGGNLRLNMPIVGEGSFLHTGLKSYNRLPDEMKSLSSTIIFKKQVKKWTSLNIPIE